MVCIEQCHQYIPQLMICFQGAANMSLDINASEDD